MISNSPYSVLCLSYFIFSSFSIFQLPSFFLSFFVSLFLSFFPFFFLSFKKRKKKGYICNFSPLSHNLFPSSPSPFHLSPSFLPALISTLLHVFSQCLPVYTINQDLKLEAGRRLTNSLRFPPYFFILFFDSHPPTDSFLLKESDFLLTILSLFFLSFFFLPFSFSFFLSYFHLAVLLLFLIFFFLSFFFLLFPSYDSFFLFSDFRFSILPSFLLSDLPFLFFLSFSFPLIDSSFIHHFPFFLFSFYFFISSRFFFCLFFLFSFFFRKPPPPHHTSAEAVWRAVFIHT
ncbi:unnamed protein product [Acanthosepion pharaonis]|uniref:Uncharacterized protein n=1 Tax=Acanthosepion pharaonis TaxID=158019 RepID=A0A812CET5_ACAPH|nr:unnamed protein product [Sepia pharaonis]